MNNKADVAAFYRIMFLKEDIGCCQKVIDSLKEEDLSNVSKIEAMVMEEHTTVQNNVTAQQQQKGTCPPQFPEDAIKSDDFTKC